LHCFIFLLSRADVGGTWDGTETPQTRKKEKRKKGWGPGFSRVRSLKQPPPKTIPIFSILGGLFTGKKTRAVSWKRRWIGPVQERKGQGTKGGENRHTGATFNGAGGVPGRDTVIKQWRELEKFFSPHSLQFHVCQRIMKAFKGLFCPLPASRAFPKKFFLTRPLNCTPGKNLGEGALRTPKKYPDLPDP